jgi:DNA-directed RNA polymerase specialized sigma24 family protein
LPTGSVSQWIGQLKAGDEAAAHKLWERYFPRIAALARLKLQSSPRGAANEEDVALSAFASFCQGAREGDFPQLLDRDNLWRLLVVLTVRKIAHLRRYEGQKKRAAGRRSAALDQVAGREPTPDLAVEMVEQCRQLLDALDDDELESIALWKMEGYTNDEIAARLDCAPRTIERKLRLIRCIWEKEGTS